MIRHLALVVFAMASIDIARAEMPQDLVETLARTQAPADVRDTVEAGGAVVWVYERDTGAEQVSVAGLVKLSSSPQKAADDVFSRPSLIETDTVKASGDFREPPVLGDVAGYRVTDSDLEALADCEVHACKFKLGERALEKLESIDWDAPDARSRVDELVRQRMVELAAAYQKEGRAALGRYLDKPNARSVSEATGILLEQMHARGLLEKVRTHLGGYPKTRVPGARDRLHWSVRDYGYRPVTSIVHTVAFASETGEPARLVAAETLYSSHYFYARLQLMGLYTDTASSQTYAILGDRLLFDDEIGKIQRRVLLNAVLGDMQEELGKLRETYRDE